MSFKGKMGGVAVLTAVMLSAAPAQAVVTDTFAQFFQTNTNAKIFNYVNVTSGANKATFKSSGSTVNLSSLGTLAPSVASVTLNATSTALPVAGTLTTTQLFSGTLSFTLLAPKTGLDGHSSTNALTVSFMNAALKAEPGTSAPTLQADTAAGSTIVYTSSFFDFSDTKTENFSLGFSGSTKALTLKNGRLPNFNVSGSGTFAAANAVPEPASWAMMLGGFGLVGGALRSRRKTVVAFG